MTAAGYTVERGTPASRLGALASAVLLAVLLALPFWGSSSDMRLLVEFLSMLTLAQMWDLVAGYGGLVSVGQQADVGLGGYALNVLADFLGVNPFLSVFLAGFVTAAVALPTAAVVFRFQGGYFAVGTWVVAEVYYLLVANSSSLGGGLGRSLQAIRSIPRTERERLTYWIALAAGVGAVALGYGLLRSRRGDRRDGVGAPGPVGARGGALRSALPPRSAAHTVRGRGGYCRRGAFRWGSRRPVGKPRAIARDERAEWNASSPRRRSGSASRPWATWPTRTSP